jgi:UrcA family protein
MHTLITTTRLRRLIATAMLGALAPGFAGIAAAADGMLTRNLSVNYGDLNLSNPQGANTLYRRIVRAARDVCDLPDDNVVPSLNLDAESCRAKAISDAVTMVGSHELIAVYNANNRHPFPITIATR